jgi:hypothetical protein
VDRFGHELARIFGAMAPNAAVAAGS